MIAKLKPFLWIFAAAIAAWGASFVFSHFEATLYDARLPLRADRGWPKDVVFVPIDDATLNMPEPYKFGTWPWTRDKQADLLDRIHALGAKTIWYDVFLGTVGPFPEADQRLAQSLDGVVLGIASSPSSGETLRPALQDALADVRAAPDNYRRVDQLVIPLDAFAARAKGIGHSVVFPDADGVSRSIAPAIGVVDGKRAVPGGVLLTPLVAFLAQRDLDPRCLQVSPDRLRLPDGVTVPLHDGSFLLDFAADAGNPPDPRIPAREIFLANAAEQATLRKTIGGKLAIVYMDNGYTQDLLTVPNVAKKVPGGVVLATALRTFDSGASPRRGSALIALLALAAAGMAAARWLWRQHPYRVLEVGGLTVIAVVAATSIPVVLFDYFPPVVAPMVFVLAVTGVFSLLGLRSLDTQNRQLQSLVQAAKNVGSGVSNPVQQLAVQPAGGGEDPPTRKVDGLGDAPTGSPRTGRHSHPSRDSAALLLQGHSLEEDIELGKYLIKRSLGRGGMGAIFLAIDQELDRPVVIKLLDSADPTALMRFKREAHAVARINHPNVVQIYDFKTDTHPPYICMEYVAGGTLGDLLRDQDDQPVEWRRASRIIAYAAAGLGAAHAKRMVHRDVKPANILLTDRRGDVAKVADFGIAKLADADALTTEGSFVGTIGYLAPEQAMGKEVDARSDVYSLALTWFRLLTGRRAFDGTTQEILRRTVEATIPDPRQLNPNVPLPVAELLLRMADLNPERRPKDGKVVAEAIAAILPTTEDSRRVAP